MNICVFAGAAPGADPACVRAAEALGALLAGRGHTLVFGGGATGLMGSVARASRARGGRVIGVAPRFFDTEGVLFQDCTEFIFTGTMRERKQIMEDMSDAFAALPGGIGTFEEFFEIITLRQLARIEKPAALFSINGYYDPLDALVDTAMREGFLRHRKEELYRSFENAEKLVEYLESHFISPD